jgi:hypothetical protein
MEVDTGANFSCADTSQFSVLTNHPFSIQEDAPNDVNPTANADHTYRNSS